MVEFPLLQFKRRYSSFRDNHQYVSDRDKRREFVSGFTGSAGLALITRNEALLWTDGRYFLQAALELSDQWKLMRMGGDPVVDVWMVDQPLELSVLFIQSSQTCGTKGGVDSAK
ncbi:unnamed protein product [Camellia sinensis]